MCSQLFYFFIPDLVSLQVLSFLSKEGLISTNFIILSLPLKTFIMKNLKYLVIRTLVSTLDLFLVEIPNNVL